MANRAIYQNRRGQVGHWKYHGNVSASGIWYDVSGNNNTGTLQGNAFIDVNGVNLDGTGDAVDFGDVLDDVFAGAGKSFSIWAYVKIPSTDANTHVIVSKLMDGSNGGDGREWAMSMVEHKLYFSWSGQLAGGSARDHQGSTILDDNSWHYIVVNYDGSQSADNRVTSYIDAVSELMPIVYSNGSPTQIADGPAHLSIGAAIGSTGTQSYNTAGIIDDIRIYNRALSAEEIKQMYYQTKGLHI